MGEIHTGYFVLCDEAVFGLFRFASNRVASFRFCVESVRFRFGSFRFASNRFASKPFRSAVRFEPLRFASFRFAFGRLVSSRFVSNRFASFRCKPFRCKPFRFFSLFHGVRQYLEVPTLWWGGVSCCIFFRRR